MKTILAALSEELAAIDRDRFPHLAFWETGPGKLQAGVQLSRLLSSSTDPVSELVVLGTCGSSDAAHVTRVVEFGSVRERGSDAELASMMLRRDVTPPRRLPCGDGTGPTLFTGDTFVTSDVATDAEWKFFDMEAYAYVWVAGLHAVPIRVIKYVTDQAETAEAWRDQLSAASRALAQHLDAMA